MYGTLNKPYFKKRRSVPLTSKRIPSTTQ